MISHKGTKECKGTEGRRIVTGEFVTCTSPIPFFVPYLTFVPLCDEFSPAPYQRWKAG